MCALVTGVQTCALPICASTAASSGQSARAPVASARAASTAHSAVARPIPVLPIVLLRSLDAGRILEATVPAGGKNRQRTNQKSVVEGKRGSVRGAIGGCGLM